MASLSPPPVTVLARHPDPDVPHLARLRVASADGSQTTVHVATYPRPVVTVRLQRLDPPQKVVEWAKAADAPEVMSGGFFAKPDFDPLGELVLGQGASAHRPFRAPWAATRGCLWLRDADGQILPRSEAVPNAGDQLLQAGPILVRDGRLAVADVDPEGFSSTCDEFDQDFTAERLPRTAVGVSARSWLSVAVDGRGDEDAGLFLGEFAALLMTLGATAALNLDGGSSSALVAGGELRNCPRDDDGDLLPTGAPTTTAIVFDSARR